MLVSCCVWRGVVLHEGGILGGGGGDVLVHTGYIGGGGGGGVGDVLVHTGYWGGGGDVLLHTGYIGGRW